jgi:DNA-binding YbaB/EbfC family protein
MKMNRQLGKLMKQAQEMQSRIAEIEEEVRAREFKATAGGGAIEVVVNGSHEVKSIRIDPKVVEPDEVDMLEDLVVAAVNEAHRQAESEVKAEMDKATGGMGLGGMDLGGML